MIGYGNRTIEALPLDRLKRLLQNK